MDSAPNRDVRVLRAFWLACGLAATGAIGPALLATGGPSHVLGGTIAFAIAAAAMAVNALLYPRGWLLATALYVVAWLSIVYGILWLVAIPLQLATAGSCPDSATGCASGFTSAFNVGIGAGIGIGLITGALALQAGLYGVRIVYRGSRNQAMAPAAAPPPERVARREKISAPPPVDVPPETTPSPRDIGDRPATSPAATAAELPAPAEQDELPAHEEPAELPPHPASSAD